MSRYGVRIFWVAVVILALVALTSVARRVATVQRLEAEQATATAVYGEVNATYVYLQTQIARATAGLDFDERVREEMGMVRDGDQVIVPVPVGTPHPQATQPSAAPETTPAPPPWQVWWRLFFGPLE